MDSIHDESGDSKAKEAIVDSKSITARQKKIMLIILITNQIANGTIYLNIAAFMPLYVKQKYSENITPTMVSLILSSFEFSCIFSSMVHQITISKMGRKNAILIAYFILSVATASLGLLDYFDQS